MTEKDNLKANTAEYRIDRILNTDDEMLSNEEKFIKKLISTPEWQKIPDLVQHANKQDARVKELENQLNGLRSELQRHCEFVTGGRMIEFKSYYFTHDSEGYTFPAAKVSESPFLTCLLKEV